MRLLRSLFVRVCFTSLKSGITNACFRSWIMPCPAVFPDAYGAFTFFLYTLLGTNHGKIAFRSPQGHAFPSPKRVRKTFRGQDHSFHFFSHYAGILVALSRKESGSFSYNPTTVVLVVECVKLVAATALYAKRSEREIAFDNRLCSCDFRSRGLLVPL